MSTTVTIVILVVSLVLVSALALFFGLKWGLKKNSYPLCPPNNICPPVYKCPTPLPVLTSPTSSCPACPVSEKRFGLKYVTADENIGNIYASANSTIDFLQQLACSKSVQYLGSMKDQMQAFADSANGKSCVDMKSEVINDPDKPTAAELGLTEAETAELIKRIETIVSVMIDESCVNGKCDGARIMELYQGLLKSACS